MNVIDKKYLIVIPVYNHGDTLREVTRRAIETDIHVLVVDDGSQDGGVDSLHGLDCQLLRLPYNQGKGAALLAGAQFAVENNYDGIVTVDADGQHDPADAMKIVEESKKYSWPLIMIGAREMDQEAVPRSSRFGRDFSNFWVRLECGAEIEDTQSGLRLYPARELLDLKLSKTRYDFEIEAIVKAVWAGIKVYSVAVSVFYPPSGQRISHFDQLVDNWRLTRLHSMLFFRRLLPLPHKRLVADLSEKKEPVVVVKKPLKTLKNLCQEHASPFWLAVAVWMGIFLGALPLIACHTIVIIYVAYRLHLNKIAAVAASQFCMPPVVPVLCIEVGYFIRHGEFIVDLSWQKWLLEIHHRLLDWLLGSLVVGPLFGLFGGIVVYLASRRVQQRNPKFSG